MSDNETLADRFQRENVERRREDRNLELESEAIDVANASKDASKPVKVNSIDFQAESNAAKHHCDKYDLVTRQKDNSVIRRGGAFTIIVTFSKEVDLIKSQHVKITFSFGKDPKVHTGTQAVLDVTGKTVFDQSHEDWDIRIAEKKSSSEITFEVQVPTDAPIGIWKTKVEVKSKSDSSIRHLHRSDHLTYILFNPWNENDATYLPEEDKRQEYVLNDVGKVFVGSYTNIRGRDWVFGQFDDAVLPSSILLLEKAGVSFENMGDPIRISRAISRIVNSNDDEGVMEGRWDGEYEDGTIPTKWTGSIAILEEYLRYQRPILYGQCWVFAGVVTTVCRAIGLPSRVVTNLGSAHDSNGSLTIDKYVDEDGDVYEGSTFGPNPSGIHDAIWNFHTWNDVWMTRPDLPEGYGGWQAIDATPQETSDGVFQCGPVSLEAIRQGQIHFLYDTQFALAEVNADCVTWQVDEEAPDGFRRLRSSNKHVGKQVLTKVIGDTHNDDSTDTNIEDITDQYKYREGSLAERNTLYRAARQTRAARNAFEMPSKAFEDVEFTMEDIEKVAIGDDFSITVKVKNVSDAERTISVSLRANSTYYNGAKAHTIETGERIFVLEPNESKTYSIPVSYDRYYSKLVEHAMVKLVCLCNVNETSYGWIGEDTFQFLKPSIEIQVPSDAVVNKPLSVMFSFMNPLATTLKQCELRVDAPGIVRPKTAPLKNVAAKSEMKYEMKLLPKKALTNCTIIATFNSKELSDLTGSVKVTIAPAEA